MRIGNNSYCDDGELIVARCAARLRLFRAFNCHFGWEAAVAISINLIHLEELAVENNREM